MDLLGIGLRRTLAAIRAGDSRWVFVGAALLAIGVARRMEGPKRQLVYSRNLKKGEAIKVRLARPGDAAQDRR